ncbi:hypothetical protein ABIE65_004701 [Constrictibacter sp. MBR-5]
MMVVLLVGQLLVGKKRFWLPAIVRRRSIASEMLDKTMSYVRPVARAVDKVVKPRLTLADRRRRRPRFSGFLHARRADDPALGDSAICRFSFMGGDSGLRTGASSQILFNRCWFRQFARAMP